MSLLHTPESGPVANSIKNKLEKAFTPVKLVLTDNSHLHLGHAEAKEAVESHFDLLIIAETFQGESKMSRHRSIYGVLSEEMREKIHALSITALTPQEYLRKNL